MKNVEPQIAAELKEMLPLPDGRRADWTDVMRRAGIEDASGVPAPGLRLARRRWRPLVAVGVAAALVATGVGIALTRTASGGQGLDQLLAQVRNSFGDDRLVSASFDGSTLTVKVDAADEPSAVSATFEAQMLAAAFHDSVAATGEPPIHSVRYVDASGAPVAGYGSDPVVSDAGLSPLADGTCRSLAESVQTSSLTVESALTLPYAGGACAFRFQTSDASQLGDTPLLVGTLVNGMGEPNKRAYLVEIDNKAGVPLIVADSTAGAGGVAYSKQRPNPLASGGLAVLPPGATRPRLQH
jgi:hypothetical protein